MLCVAGSGKHPIHIHWSRRNQKRHALRWAFQGLADFFFAGTMDCGSRMRPRQLNDASGSSVPRSPRGKTKKLHDSLPEIDWQRQARPALDHDRVHFQKLSWRLNRRALPIRKLAVELSAKTRHPSTCRETEIR